MGLGHVRDGHGRAKGFGESVMGKQPRVVCVLCEQQIGRHDRDRFMQAVRTLTSPGYRKAWAHSGCIRRRHGT